MTWRDLSSTLAVYRRARHSTHARQPTHSECLTSTPHSRDTASRPLRYMDIELGVGVGPLLFSFQLDVQRLKEVWKGFEASLEDGEKFVKTQTPIKAQGLQESISVCPHHTVYVWLVHWDPVIPIH